jgi:anti-anti-sigma factor
MTLAARALAGVCGGDHVCCVFGAEAEQQGLIARFARDALARGERLLYMSDRTDEATVRDFLDVAGVDSARCLTSGQLHISSAREVYRAPGGFDPEGQIAHFEAEKRTAHADGFSGLAAMAEMSWALNDPRIWNSLVWYEREVQQVFAAADVRGVCQYDRRLFPSELLEEAIAAHELAVGLEEGSSHARWRDLTIREFADLDGVHISGDLDFAASPYVSARLAEHLPGSEDIVVDVGGLSFVDVSGCRALIETLLALKPPRRLVLADPSPVLQRVLELCEWRDLPRLELLAGTGRA